MVKKKNPVPDMTGMFNADPNKKGRKKGTPNIKKKDNGMIVNKHGVEFTKEEKKKLEYKVNSANRKRKRLLEIEGSQMRTIAGKSTGRTVAQSAGAFGYESDMMLHKRSKSIHKFRSRKEYDTYMRNLEIVTDRGYIDKRVQLYKDNHVKSLKKVFDEKGMSEDLKVLTDVINNMSPAEYQKFVMRDEIMNIEYMYTKEEKKMKMKQMKSALEKYLPESA